MVDLTLPLPGLSPIAGKEVVARFDGGRLSSDGDLLLLREIERRLAVAERLAACIEDRRDPGSTLHTLADIIRFRLLMIAAGYEDGNDATSLRVDPVFKMALDRLPSGRDLCSQSTISRLENLPDIRTLLRLGGALVDLYCGSFRQVPRRITLDIDDTFDAVHGGQQLRLFNAHYDDYGFQPIVVLDEDGRFVTAVLRPAKRPKGVEIRAFLRRLVRAIRGNWPQVARRQPLRLPASTRLVRGERDRLRVRPRPDQHMEASRRRCGGEHLGPFQGRSERRQRPPLQGVLRRRTHLEPGPPHRRPRRGRQRRHRYPLHRHHPRPRQRPFPLPGPLLPAWPGGKSHQGLENPPRRRPYLVPQGHRQPVPVVPARRRLLAAVEPARTDAQGLVLAGRAVRHAAAAPRQDRRPHRRDENQDQGPSADQRARSIDPPPRPRPPAAAGHLKVGAVCPCRALPRNLQRLSAPPIPHSAAAATDRLASNNHYSYCRFNTQYMLFPGE